MAALNEVLKPLKQSAVKARQLHPLNPLRKLSKNELQEVNKQINSSLWDEGIILDFIKTVDEPIAIDLTSGATLIYYGDKKYINKIAETTDQLCNWLGVSSAFIAILFYMDKPRYIEADEWPEKKNVNGGWNMTGSQTIVIYRREEWERVFIHETIHAMNWDWKHMPTKQIKCWGLQEESELSPHLFEAWTELLTELLYCVWFNLNWNDQLKWMKEQAIQIISRYHTKDKWIENTNVFAYYILKAALSKYVAELFLFGKPEEYNEYILCELVTPEINKLYEAAKGIHPKRISLRMTHFK